MTIKHMRIFVVVCQKMNITKAAEVLNMTQPAVSRAIQELERYYGIHLFERINHRLYKTHSCDELYAHALHLLELFDTMEKEMKKWEELGELRIGATNTLGNLFVPEVVSQFQKLHPQLKISAHIFNSSKLQQAVLNNEIDIGLVEDTITSDYLSMEFLYEDRLCLVLPKHNPLNEKNSIAVKDLITYPLLLREQGSSGRSLLDSVFASYGLSIHPLWESTSTQALIQGVSKGIGISILPEKLVKSHLDLGIVSTCPIENDVLKRKNYIVWHKQKYLSKNFRQFIALCHEISKKQEAI